MAKRQPKSLRCPALRLDQGSGIPLYLFSLTGEELQVVSEISRVGRDESGRLVGYQRLVMRRHVREITEYLNSDSVLLPNSIVLALDSSVRFKPTRRVKASSRSCAGVLEIPIPRRGGSKPAWIVDGQQRAAALSQCRRKDLTVPVNAFVANSESVQREHFLRVNSTKPLPRGLITELIPEIPSVLPARLAARKVPAALCDLLNRDPESPFRGLIRRSSTSVNTRRRAIVSDTALIKVIGESFNTPSGCLFSYRNVATGSVDAEGIRKVLLTYWNAVKDTFPEAWGIPPHRSRLMHGAGIVAMGRLMDRMMASVDINHGRPEARVLKELARLKPLCSWTDGAWEGIAGMRWNEVQNVPSHVRLLSNFLIRSYFFPEEAAG